jgi:hypothetical protein
MPHYPRTETPDVRGFQIPNPVPEIPVGDRTAFRGREHQGVSRAACREFRHALQNGCRNGHHPVGLPGLRPLTQAIAVIASTTETLPRSQSNLVPVQPIQLTRTQAYLGAKLDHDTLAQANLRRCSDQRLSLVALKEVDLMGADPRATPGLRTGSPSRSAGFPSWPYCGAGPLGGRRHPPSWHRLLAHPRRHR